MFLQQFAPMSLPAKQPAVVAVCAALATTALAPPCAAPCACRVLVLALAPAACFAGAWVCFRTLRCICALQFCALDYRLRSTHLRSHTHARAFDSTRALAHPDILDADRARAYCGPFLIADRFLSSAQFHAAPVNL
jgi:hypothetical protein